MAKILMVILLKKIILLIFFLFILNLNIKSKNYNYVINDETYEYRYVSIENLNTNNFINYFKEVNVISIYPKVNPIYKDKIGNIYYKFINNNISEEIEKFKYNYIKLIKKNSYSDYNYLYVSGINIDKVLIYISNKELNNFINKTGASILK